jgi:MoaA/NifB/PqqE/SkfB family radical SAM enzyme
MKFIHNTVSLCEYCYRHIPANRFEKDGNMILGKECPKHGYQEAVLDINIDFYKSQQYQRRRPGSYWLDITNRCNLDCPHCYQMPDNNSKDPSIDYLLSEVMSWPDNGYPVSLVGAEPTVRKDLPNLILAIQALPIKTRNVIIVTNGVYLAKWDYVERFKGIPNLKWTFGLNHPEYNGGQIRDKQMEGLENCFKLGLDVKTLTYTLANLEQLSDVMYEVQKFGINARIQLGVEIGRVPEGKFKELYLSELVAVAKQFCIDNKWTWEPDYIGGNRTHYAVRINGIEHKFIKWCDVRTIDLEEVQSESWASIVPGKPMSPLLHQVILRDQIVNRGQMLFDTVPKKYRHE